MSTMRLRVDARSGAIVLSFPKHVSQRRALDWAERQHAWIAARMAEVPPAVPLAEGNAIPFRGMPHRIVANPDARRGVTVLDIHLEVGGPRDLLPQRLERWLRQEAQRLLFAETGEFARKADVGVSGVAIGDPISRWGSCTSSGAIRYSWRLILAPDWVRRATVAHEVAHRVHMNHGPAFHALVEHLLGCDPSPARAWLRAHGGTLHRIAPKHQS